MARKHIQAIGSARGAELVGVFSKDAARARAYARRLGIRAYPDYEDMLADSGIDVFDIVTCNHLHADYGLRAIKAGKHVLVEKPIDTSTEKARKLVMKAERKERVLSCVSQFLYAPDVARLKSDLEQGSAGRICQVKANVDLCKSKGYYQGWRARKQYAGGGVVIMNLIHLIDVFNYLFGDIQHHEAFLKTTRNGIEVEDYAKLSLEYPGGVPCVITATTSAPRTRPVEIEVVGREKAFRLRNFCLPGVRSLKARMDISGKCLKLQILDVMDAIKKGRPPIADGRRGLKSLETIHEIYNNARWI
jgi:predicted dehydrogenase